jgi:hypothetical protein
MRLYRPFLRIISLIGITTWLIACGGGGGGSSGDGSNDNPCGTVVDIGPNSITDGVLEAGDCRASDVDHSTSDPSFVDEYRITLNALETLTINMRSSNLDTYLYLANRSTSCSSGCTTSIIIAFDDDSGGGVNSTDALISMDLARGTYLIGANSFDPQAGSYTLETATLLSPPGLYKIGQLGPAGGIVFYITNGGLNGLEVAPVDQSAGAFWGCQGTVLFVSGTAIGTGAQNTADILAGCSDPGIAARIANDYTLNGFGDWFLPSQDELNELYLQRAVVGGYTTGVYWSSSEALALSAKGQDFTNGSVFIGDKNNNTGVRAIRAF